MAGKRRAATKVEVFYIKNNPEGKTAQELADELELFKSTVDKILLEKANEEIPASDTPKLSNGLKINKNDIIRETGSGKKGVVALTSTSSEKLSDMHKEVFMGRTPNYGPKTGICKSYPDRE